jgi:NDP-sugar pyrophosphorylase family protein/phosphoheptose isomerase
MKALILAAGAGTRLRPLTDELPKPMLPVAGVPLLEHTVQALRRQGITELAVNLHHLPDAVTRHFGDGRRFGVRITYSPERTLLGTAGAARRLRSFLDETFLVIYGDVLTDLSFTDLAAFHRERGAVLTLAVHRVADPTAAGLVGVDATGRVTRFVEKPAPEEVFTDLVNAGVLVVEPSVLDGVPAGCPCDFGRDVLPRLLAAGARVHARRLGAGDYLIDIGSPASYLRAQTEWPARRRAAVPPIAPDPTTALAEEAAGSLVDDYLVRLERTVRELSRTEIVAVVRRLLEAWRAGRKVVVMGNGGSAATASHMVNDLTKLTLSEGWPRLRAVSLTDNVPLLTAWGNDAAFDRVFVEPLLGLVDPGDVVIGISTSGNSPNVLAALEAARRCGAVTVGLTGRSGGRLPALVDHCVRVPSDHIGRQEDVHLVLNHVVANTLRQLAAGRSGAPCAAEAAGDRLLAGRP